MISESWPNWRKFGNVQRRWDNGMLIEVKNLKKWFPLHEGWIAALLSKGEQGVLKAVDGVSFEMDQGEVLGLAGESGCGKTTIGMTLMKLYEPTSGEILFDGQNVVTLLGKNLKPWRRKAQIVFQNPYESLNPRFTIIDTLMEPLHIHQIGTKDERTDIIRRTLEDCGLKPVEDYIHKFPHELSGGQRQRVSIAKAMVLKPRFIVADEPVSMLDVSIRAGILKLLKSLSQNRGLTILYISHDLSSMGYICDRIAIMYLGKIVEVGPPQAILDRPSHPYTQALISAVPVSNPSIKRKRVNLPGEIPNPIDLPQGCRFRPRCKKMMDCCLESEPGLTEIGEFHSVSCHLYL